MLSKVVALVLIALGTASTPNPWPGYGPGTYYDTYDTYVSSGYRTAREAQAHCPHDEVVWDYVRINAPAAAAHSNSGIRLIASDVLVRRGSPDYGKGSGYYDCLGDVRGIPFENVGSVLVWWARPFTWLAIAAGLFGLLGVLLTLWISRSAKIYEDAQADLTRSWVELRKLVVHGGPAESLKLSAEHERTARAPSDIDDTAQTLKIFFRNNQLQLNVFFVASVFAMIAGFIIVAISIFVLGTGSALGIIAGAVTEFISGTFIVCYRFALGQATEYARSLERFRIATLRDRHRTDGWERSVEVAKLITDEDAKNRTLGDLARVIGTLQMTKAEPE